MNIKMLQTVEDSHPSVETIDGKPKVSYDVRKLYQGQSYDLPDDRAEKLIGFGYAEAV